MGSPKGVSLWVINVIKHVGWMTETDVKRRETLSFCFVILLLDVFGSSEIRRYVSRWEKD